MTTENVQSSEIMLTKDQALDFARTIINEIQDGAEQIAVPMCMIKNPNDPIGIKNVNFSYECALDEGDDRHAKWLEQRLTRGFDDTELWNLDHTILQFIEPRLKAFAAGAANRGYPGNVNSAEEWQEMLDEMIFAVDWYLDEDKEEWEMDEQGNFKRSETNELVETADHKRAKAGWKLLGENFFGLWD